jgi:very-short-patch-repair endonuclease
MGIPREPADPQDAVETTRAAPDDKETIQADYGRTGSIRRLADLYGIGEKGARALLVAHGIPLKPRGHAKGQKQSQAWREASAKHWDDPAWREKQRQLWIERVRNTPTGNTNSPLEQTLHKALLAAGISFTTQQLLLDRYLVDILITQKPIVIEADGNGHLLTVEKDAVRDADLRAAGYEVFRFTGKPIINDPQGCVQQVVDTAGLVPESEPEGLVYNGATGSNNPRWTGGKPEWTCEVCGTVFLAYKVRGKPRRTCSRECQTEWQRTSRASVIGRRSNSEQMRALWDDPEWRERQIQLQREGRWGKSG